MKVPNGFEACAAADGTLWVRSDVRPVFEGRRLLPRTGPPPEGIDPVPLTGRGGAYGLRWPGVPFELVYRRLTHGGALRGITRDRFVGPRPRPFVEVQVSEHLAAQGVPTPRVVLAVVRRGACGVYRGALVTERVPGARALADELGLAARGEAERVRALLVAAGRVVRRMHDARIVHADLNLRNLIHVPPARESDEGDLQIIDLDGSPAAGAALENRLRVANVERMLRSLRKFPDAARVAAPFARAALLEGYEQASAAPSAGVSPR